MQNNLSSWACPGIQLSLQPTHGSRDKPGMAMLWGMLAALCLLLFAPNAHAARPIPEPRLIAVYAYADWCPNCKALSPKLAEARKSLDANQTDILFITLDLTDKPRIRQSLLHAQALGLGEWLRTQGSATGYVALIDAKTKQEVGRFDNGDDVEEIKKLLLAPND